MQDWVLWLEKHEAEFRQCLKEATEKRRSITMRLQQVEGMSCALRLQPKSRESLPDVMWARLLKQQKHGWFCFSKCSQPHPVFWFCNIGGQCSSLPCVRVKPNLFW
ncbi:unnamed protein product [Durusdinium trenchii]|uniref:Uncharacterized protein n=1 Tax=Durusdinium trenchii TaxID=1381693 RepID=A0ABP0SDS1_9DINO